MNPSEKNHIKALKMMIDRPMPTDPYTPEQAQKILKEKYNITYGTN